jgi:hypothetical protein
LHYWAPPSDYKGTGTRELSTGGDNGDGGGVGAAGDQVALTLQEKGFLWKGLIQTKKATSVKGVAVKGQGDCTFEIVLAKRTYVLLAKGKKERDALVELIKPPKEADIGLSKCKQCRRTYSIFRKKHLCRACKNYFCHTCSRHYCDIPGQGEPGMQERVCDRCNISIMDGKWKGGSPAKGKKENASESENPQDAETRRKQEEEDKLKQVR